MVVVPAGEMPAPGSLIGKVAVFEVPPAANTYPTIRSIAYGIDDPDHLINPAGLHLRPWEGVGTLITLLDPLPAAGAVGAVAIIDLPSAGA